MKKIIAKLALLVAGIISSLFIFSGCTYKTYEFIGIVDPTTNDVVLYENLTDEQKEAVSNSIGENATIRLKENGTFIFQYTVVDGSLEITYKQTGTYTLKEDEKTIIFHFPAANGSDTNDINQQYENGKIIYYNGGTYLVFQ